MASGTLVNETKSLCKVCKTGLAARIIATESNEVWLEKTCPEHGFQEVRLSTNAEWYIKTREISPPSHTPAFFNHEIENGCPFDCGPCADHKQEVKLPVVTITSSCNLDCPICYVHNKNNDAFHMGTDEFRKVLEHIVRRHQGDLDIVNFTGGEPTLHPHFLDFLALAQEYGIKRVTICSNGIRLANDESLVEKIARLNGRIALSFDTYEEKADIQLQGKSMLEYKIRCLDLLEKYNVDTTLIPVMTKGVNDHEIGKIIDLAVSKKNIRHLEIHTITFTGQGGQSFDRSTRISMFEVLQQIEKSTSGMIKVDDFIPSPCAHSLCYQIVYLLLDPTGGPAVPYTRFMPKDIFYELLGDSLYLKPSAKLQKAMQEAMNNLWADGSEESARILKILKTLVDNMFPADGNISYEEQLKIGEMSSKAIYVHSHMDEETFDNERIEQCCDSNCYSDGRTIPVCSYNVLYRETEKRFMSHPKKNPLLTV